MKVIGSRMWEKSCLEQTKKIKLKLKIKTSEESQPFIQKHDVTVASSHSKIMLNKWY